MKYVNTVDVTNTNTHLLNKTPKPTKIPSLKSESEFWIARFSCRKDVQHCVMLWWLCNRRWGEWFICYSTYQRQDLLMLCSALPTSCPLCRAAAQRLSQSKWYIFACLCCYFSLDLLLNTIIIMLMLNLFLYVY